MKIQIEGNRWVESDERQFILKEYTGKKDKHGTQLYKTHGYFPSVKSALEHFVKLKVMDSTATTLSELLQEVRSIRAYLESQISI